MSKRRAGSIAAALIVFACLNPSSFLLRIVYCILIVDQSPARSGRVFLSRPWRRGGGGCCSRINTEALLIGQCRQHISHDPECMTLQLSILTVNTTGLGVCRGRWSKHMHPNNVFVGGGVVVGCARYHHSRTITEVRNK